MFSCKAVLTSALVWWKCKIMKIVFENGYNYSINAIEFERDEEGAPIDIIIAADEETLNNLILMSMIGCNIREMNVADKFYGRASHIGLYARLCPFEIFSDEEYIDVY